MKYVRFYLFISSLLFISSCIKVLDLEHLRPQPKLVLNSLVVVGEPVTAAVLRTWFYTDNNPDVTFKDANVDLYVNDQFKERLVWREADPESIKDQGCYQGIYSPQVGDKIKITASMEEYEEISAEVFMPEPAEILKVTTAIRNMGVGGSINNKLKICVTFRDDPSENNFYLIDFEQRKAVRDYKTNTYTGEFEWVPMHINYSEEPMFLTDLSALENILGYDWLEYRYGRVFTDDQINGKEYTIQVLAEYYYYDFIDEDYPVAEDENNLRVCFYTITESYYRYMKSILDIVDGGLQGALAEDGLAEPLPVFSNISGGGVGILGGSNLNRVAFQGALREE